MMIRRDQMHVLGKYMRRQFEDRMTKHLRDNFPAETQALDDPNLRKLVVSGIGRAESYDIESEDDIQRYLEYVMVLSHDFDTNPKSSWARRILLRRDIDGTQKMSRIDNVYLFSRKWET
jgi:hypothetical protein